MMFLMLFQMIVNDFFELIDDILSMLSLQINPTSKTKNKKIKGLGL